MVKHFSGVIATRNGNVPCTISVAPPFGEEVRGVIACPSYSTEGFYVLPLAARRNDTGEEWAPVVRVESVQAAARGQIYLMHFVAEVGADGIP